jgi:hypothetical protein
VNCPSQPSALSGRVSPYFDIAAYLPEVLSVEHADRPISRFEVVQKARVHGNSPCLTVPGSIGLEVGAVGVQIAAAGATEVICNGLRVPSVNRIAIG